MVDQNILCIIEHEKTWFTNGLYDLKYKELNRVYLNDYSSKITIDILLNSHWTDERCGIDDTQLPS